MQVEFGKKLGDVLSRVPTNAVITSCVFKCKFWVACYE